MSKRTLADADVEKRAPVQAEELVQRRRWGRTIPAGTVSWEEHVEAWEIYARSFGRDQSAERIAERGGFGLVEMTYLLGRPPTTWRPR